jgi:DnaD/phage-associated family protein
MSGFTVYQDSYIGATIISNRFIDEYMTEANDAQLKVYLYLVRMLNAHLETSLSDIADRFNHTEKDVIRAFKYWEKKGLLTIENDEAGNITGIHLVNLCKGEVTGPTVESTHKKVKESIPAPAKKTEVIKEEYKEEDPADRVEEATEEEAENEGNIISAIPIKPSYTAKQLSKFSDDGGKQLIFLAQMYFGKPVTQNDIQTLCYISDELGLSDDLVDYLLQYCAEKGKKDLRYAEKVAIGWKENGVETVDQARNNTTKYDKPVYEIMNRLGKTGTPTVKEMEFINEWRLKDGFSDAVIMEACDRAVLSTDKNRFNYAHGILSKWKEQNVRSLEDVRRIDEEFKRSGASTSASFEGGAPLRNSSAAKKNGAGSFGNYKQSDIDYDELRKKVFAN